MVHIFSAIFVVGLLSFLASPLAVELHLQTKKRMCNMSPIEIWKLIQIEINGPTV